MAALQMMAQSSTNHAMSLLVGRQMGSIIMTNVMNTIHAPGWLRFGPTEWTNAFLDPLDTNRTRLTNRQSRRKIKEVLDKLGRVPRAHMISFNVDECL